MSDAIAATTPTLPTPAAPTLKRLAIAHVISG
jgi:hypothetical protein